MINLFFDTETSDLIKFKLPNIHKRQPWICQLAAVQTDSNNNPINTMALAIKSNGMPMSKGAEDTHGLSVEFVDTYGVTASHALWLFFNLWKTSDILIAHNLSFDIRLVAIAVERLQNSAAKEDFKFLKESTEQVCTMKSSTNFCKLPGKYGKYKWPKLEELHRILFNEDFSGAHDALVDVNATRRCYFELKKLGVM